MSVKPLGFSSIDIMEAGLAARPHDPYFDNPCSDGIWRWHASELSKCPRQLIYARAGIKPDPSPLEGRMTAQLGSTFHELLERWIIPFVIQEERATVVLTEQGFWHDTLPLATKPDLVLDVEGVGRVVIDYKTERADAAVHRAREASEEGLRSRAKADHQLQVAAQALVLESNGLGPIAQGHVVYIAKDTFWVSEFNECGVDLADGLLYAEVKRRVENLEAAWELYQREGWLPAQIDESRKRMSWWCRSVNHRQGQPNTAGTGPGRYCPARSMCRG